MTRNCDHYWNSFISFFISLSDFQHVSGFMTRGIPIYFKTKFVLGRKGANPILHFGNVRFVVSSFIVDYKRIKGGRKWTFSKVDWQYALVGTRIAKLFSKFERFSSILRRLIRNQSAYSIWLLLLQDIAVRLREIGGNRWMRRGVDQTWGHDAVGEGE